MSLLEKLGKVQTALKAPKNQKNSFGNYQYRSCEDILEAVKPLLAAHELTLTIGDSIELIGDRYYVKATAAVHEGTDCVNGIGINAYARECETKKGMDDAQLTGSCSSYARKYALNGLFLIDDTKDADSMDNSKPDYTPEQKVCFDSFFRNAQSFEFYCLSKMVGEEIYTALYNSFPSDGKIGKNKAQCNDLTKQGDVIATDIADRVTELVENDDPSYCEDLDNMTDYEKKVVASRMSKETLEKIKQMKEASK